MGYVSRYCALMIRYRLSNSFFYSYAFSHIVYVFILAQLPHIIPQFCKLYFHHIIWNLLLRELFLFLPLYFPSPGQSTAACAWFKLKWIETLYFITCFRSIKTWHYIIIILRGLSWRQKFNNSQSHRYKIYDCILSDLKCWRWQSLWLLLWTLSKNTSGTKASRVLYFGMCVFCGIKWLIVVFKVYILTLILTLEIEIGFSNGEMCTWFT